MPDLVVELMDTTLRDGEQTQGVSFSPDEKVNIAKALLASLKVDRIEVASARISDGERQAVTQIMIWAEETGRLEQVEVLGFTDHTESVDWILASGGRVVNLLTKGSERHCHEQLRKSLAEHLSDIEKTLDYAHEQQLIANIYLEDWSNGYRDNRSYVYQFMDTAINLGIRRFMLPDTLGVMSPVEVTESIRDMHHRYPDAHFDFHPHNDYGMATANAMAAVLAGARGIHCTINCLGERAGNAPLASVAVVLKDKLQAVLNIDERQIRTLSKMVENFSGKRLADNTPIVGSDVFTQTSGIHADGDKKGGLYQTMLGPERFGRERSYALGKMSGKASLAKNLEVLDLSLSEEHQKKILQRIVALGDMKEIITPEDLPFIIADVLESKEYRHIELLNCSITSGLDMESTASIRVRLQNEIYKSSGSGNGGFDAFIDAMKKVLQHCDFEFPKLQDYNVRIPPGGKTSALTECFISWQDADQSYRTRGVHSNQVFASVNAALRMINMKLHRQFTVESIDPKISKSMSGSEVPSVLNSP